MDVLNNNALSTILVRPIGYGQADRPCAFYVVDPHSGLLTWINESLVPQTKLVADGGGVYSFRQQNGWILDVPHITRPRETWTAQAMGDDIQIETPHFKFRVIKDGVRVTVRATGPVGHYTVSSAQRKFAISGWFWFPWYRTLFLEDPCDQLRCLPFSGFLCDLNDAKRVKEIAAQWAIGIHIFSSAFILPKDLHWSIEGNPIKS